MSDVQRSCPLCRRLYPLGNAGRAWCEGQSMRVTSMAVRALAILELGMVGGAWELHADNC